MAFQIVNFLEVTLATSIGAEDTTINVLDTELPIVSIYEAGKTLSLTIVEETSDQHEIIYVTGQTGTTLFVQRGQDGTLARGHEAGRRIVAATNKEVLTALLSSPTNAASVSYVENSSIIGDTVQEALDDIGQQLSVGSRGNNRPAALARTFGVEMPGNQSTVDPLYQGSSRRITTNGVGGNANSGLFPVGISGPIDFNVRLMVRVDNLTDLLSMSMNFYSEESTYRIDFNRLDIPASMQGQWFPLIGATATAVESAAVPANVGKAELNVKDDGTGIVNFDIASLDFYPYRDGQTLAVREVTTLADAQRASKAGAVDQGMVLVIGEGYFGNIFMATDIARLLREGCRIAVRPSDSLKSQSLSQLRGICSRIKRLGRAYGFTPFAIVYPDSYVGLLDSGEARIWEVAADYFDRGIIQANSRAGNFDDFPMVIPATPITGAVPDVTTDSSLVYWLNDNTAVDSFAAKFRARRSRRGRILGAIANMATRLRADIAAVALTVSTLTAVVAGKQPLLSGLRNLEFAGDLAADGNTTFDFHSSPSADYDLRIYRNLGVNGEGGIYQSGTGDLHLDGGTRLMRGPNVIWHAGNQGAGSGMDADTVDGLQANSFLRGDQTSTAKKRLNIGNDGGTDALFVGSIGNTFIGFYRDINYTTRKGYIQSQDNGVSGGTNLTISNEAYNLTLAGDGSAYWGGSAFTIGSGTNSAPYLHMRYGGVRSWYWQVDTDAHMRLVDNSAGVQTHKFQTNGDIQMKYCSDNNSGNGSLIAWIEYRAANFADSRIGQLRNRIQSVGEVDSFIVARVPGNGRPSTGGAYAGSDLRDADNASALGLGGTWRCLSQASNSAPYTGLFYRYA